MSVRRDITTSTTGAAIACVLAWACTYPATHLHTISVVWLADGVVVLALLAQRRRLLLPAALMMSFCCFLGELAADTAVYAAFVSATGTLVASLTIYSGLVRFYDARSRRLRRAAFASMVVLAGVAAKVCAMLLLYAVDRRSVAATSIAQLSFSAVLGTLLLLSCWLHLRPVALASMFSRGNRAGTLGLLALAAAVSYVTFLQSNVPLAFLLFPTLTLVTFKRGLSGGLLAMLCVLGFVAPATARGMGPFYIHGWAVGDFRVNALVMLVLFFCLGLVYSLGSALRSRGKLESLYRLLAYNSRDIITRVNLQGIRTYASPSMREVLGWKPDEVTGVTAEDLMHPDDREKYSSLLTEMKEGHQPLPFVYRGRKRNGEYVWLEATIRLLEPEKGRPASEYVAASRDVTQRMQAERELQTAYAALERLATLDGLTQVANRHRFEEMLDREWRRSLRERTELSLLMLDVDHFKQFNDALGHPAGDACLRQVADVLTQHVQRSSDVVARYGGEEFAVLLPATSLVGAKGIAERICEALCALRILHPLSPLGHLTCSIGVASCVPDDGIRPASLVAAADAALYLAKRTGRNRVQPGQA